MRNKKAALLAGVALREFPQRWPGFVDECLSPRPDGPSDDADAGFELGLLALAELAEDCVDADYNGRLPAKRRTDVLKALNTTAPAVVTRLFAFARRSYALLRREPAVAAPAPSGALSGALSASGGGAAASLAGGVGSRRLVAALRCLRHFATWARRGATTSRAVV